MHKLSSFFAAFGCLLSLGGFAYLGAETAIRLLPDTFGGLPGDLGSLWNPVRDPEDLKTLLETEGEEVMTVHYQPLYGAEHVDISPSASIRSLRIVGGGEEADFSLTLAEGRDFFLALEDIDIRTSGEQFLDTNGTTLHLLAKGNVTVAHSGEYLFQFGYPLVGSRVSEEDVPIYLYMEERSVLEMRGGTGTSLRKDGQHAIAAEKLYLSAPEDWSGNLFLRGGDGYSPEGAGEEPGDGVAPTDLRVPFSDDTGRAFLSWGQPGVAPSL